MTTDSGGQEQNEHLWRYLSFARFVWLLQNKKLWLSRADLLGDPWELTLCGDQLTFVASRHPISTVNSENHTPESSHERAKRIVNLWRRSTFVNCWSSDSHESHALWRIYCPLVEGVAIQTTLVKLRKSVDPLAVYPVTYGTLGSSKTTPTIPDLITKKRPMISYEKEFRVVRAPDLQGPNPTIQETDAAGYSVEWDPEQHLESISVHPEADRSFMDTVISTVTQYAPALRDRVVWSAMSESPPF
jgi:hypothetical protein